MALSSRIRSTRLTALTHLEEPRKFDFIDALRGLAILAVILVHTQDTVAAGSHWLQLLMSGGARGVQLFYIASAFTLCSSWEFRSTRERHPVRNFYLRRLFRIAPMFYIAIAGYLLLYGLSPRYYAPHGTPWYYVPLTAVFLNGFHPETLTSVVPGGWSIAVEMTFYALFPLLARRCRHVVALSLLVALSLIAARVWASAVYRFYLPFYPAEESYLVDLLAVLGFPGQFPVFAMGMLAYWFFRTRSQWGTGLIAGASVWLTWLAFRIFVTAMPPAEILTLPLAMGGVFALFALALARYPLRMLVNPLSGWIGKLSFSMYLTHFAVLDAFKAVAVSAHLPAGDASTLLAYLLVVAITAGVSWLTYRLVERPAIAAGRRLIDRLEADGGP